MEMEELQRYKKENQTMPLPLTKKEKRLSMAYMYVAFSALLIGGLMGLLQVLVRSGHFELPAWVDYYQVLTMHGVILALVLTTFFIIGLQTAFMAKTVGMTDTQRKLGWFAFWMMTIGTLMTGLTIISGKASVLYTFYAPLQAHPAFYLGLVLLIVGSWIVAFTNFRQLYMWKKANPGEKSPLLAFMVVINMIM